MRLLLVRHGPTSASQSGRYPADEPLALDGVQLARELMLPEADLVLTSPRRRCRETAAAAGVAAPVIEPRLAECDFGHWAGRTLAEINAVASDEVHAWMREPAAAPHGGESLVDFAARVGGWLDELPGAASDQTVLAFTHGGVIKAAVMHVLRAPYPAFWQIGAYPLSVTELMLRCETWEIVRLNCPAGAC